MLETIITQGLSNFGVTMMVLAILAIIIQRMANKQLPMSEIIFRWLAFFPLGCTAIYAFIMHAFFAEFTAATIGWQNSPFQYEVAMANLGFGVIAILCLNASYGFRLATVIGNACWLWGDALGHVYQMMHYHNFSLGNAGSWFYMDVIMPLILLVCLARLKHAARNTQWR